MRRAGALAVAGMVAGSLVAGCGSGDSSSSSASAPAEGDQAPKFAESEATTVVHVTAHEYAYDFDKTAAAGTKVFFEVDNTGKEHHEFELLGADGKAVDEIGSFDPGTTKSLAVELKPGTYTVQCLLKNADGKVHADIGMKATLTIT